VSAERPLSVAHLVGTHLAFSETFLYRQFRAWRRYEPWVYAARLANEQKFPPERVDVPPAGVLPRLWSAALSASYAPWFVRGIRGRGTAVVHAHYGTTGTQALPFVWLERLPLVVSFYGYDVGYLHAPWRHLGYARYAVLFPLLVRAASRMLVVSESLRAELVALGAPAGRVEVHRTGIDTARFAPDPAAAPRREPAIVMSGREVEKKGFRHGFAALARVRAKGGRFRVLFHGTGNGPLREELVRSIAALGLGEVVETLAPDEPTANVLRRADLILAPSVTAADGDREGLPTVLVEAAACGVPAVASRHAGIPELVVDGESGLLCAERDVAALAGALERLLDDAALRRRMGEAARERAVAGWDAERLLRRREEIYDEVR
jgi:colanic acid/amylovoran biosynthesis glycosyltransferase